ncbi:MAG: hypothetical protein VB102_06865 [Paludibacter sp.]|nr:hypothetical protein [Paludibacter sp.]
MKKASFLFLTVLLAMAFSFTSCDKDEVEQANVQFTLNQTSFDALTYAAPVQISGSVTSDKTITGLTFTGVASEGGVYVAKGDAQAYTVNGTSSINFNMEYFVDSKAITHIEVKATVGTATKSSYIPVSAVTGEAKGSAFIGQVIMKADSIVWNAENHPEVYTTPNTGAEANTPSFFSIHGVDINGTVKHVLTGDEIRSVEGLNGSFCFINVLQNTANKAYIGGQRGYMFSNMWPSQLGGGTTGRQCDLYAIGGKAIRQANIDTTQFKIVPGSWIGTEWKEEQYKFVDSLFLVISNEATTEAAKLKAYYLLGKIQSKLDNATLGEANNPTNLGALNYARRRANAGTSGTTAMVEQYRAGDYIILKNVKGGKLYYGIMQITQIFDDTQAFVNVEGVGQKIGQEEAKMLFHKPLILNIKVQTQL